MQLGKVLDGRMLAGGLPGQLCNGDAVRTKGALSQKTVKLMVFTLVRAASKTRRRLNGANQLPRVIEGVKFTDGVAKTDPAKTTAA